ncbi:MAG: pentapeptide repeat-containing protein, partial [Alphaproteobacteria bacterium]|nr:pentapeptide repeat-containing protein [Alphaproteobacteria bacterium]
MVIQEHMIWRVTTGTARISAGAYTISAIGPKRPRRILMKQQGPIYGNAMKHGNAKVSVLPAGKPLAPMRRAPRRALGWSQSSDGVATAPLPQPLSVRVRMRPMRSDENAMPGQGATRHVLSESWIRLSQQELEEILGRHEKFAQGIQGGERAKLALHDLSHLNMAGRNMAGADLTGAILANANMIWAMLEEATLFGADLRHADLRHVNMIRADLRGVCFAGANLSRAKLDDADMRDGVLVRPGRGGDLIPLARDESGPGLDRATARGASLQRAKVSNSFIVQTDLTDCNLRHARFARTDLSLSNLTGCNLEGTDFTDAKLAGAVFRGATFNGTVLSNTDLSGADLIGAIFDSVDFAQARMADAQLPPQAEMENAALAEILVEHAKWVKTNGREGKRASLARVNMAKQCMDGANLAAADLEYAVLKDCSMIKGELIMADLSFADLRRSDLSYADLRGVKLVR